MADGTTTDTVTVDPTTTAPIETPTTPTPTTVSVPSTNIIDAMVSLFKAMAGRENIDAGVIAAAAKQHEDDQAVINAAAAAKATEDLDLATAKTNTVSPETIAAIDAATAAIESGQPLPAFPAVVGAVVA